MIKSLIAFLLLSASAMAANNFATQVNAPSFGGTNGQTAVTLTGSLANFAATPTVNGTAIGTGTSVPYAVASGSAAVSGSALAVGGANVYGPVAQSGTATALTGTIQGNQVGSPVATATNALQLGGTAAASYAQTTGSYPAMYSGSSGHASIASIASLVTASTTGTAPGDWTGTTKLPFGIFDAVGDSITSGIGDGGRFWGTYLLSGSYGVAFSNMVLVNSGTSGNWLGNLLGSGSGAWANYLTSKTGTASMIEVDIGANDLGYTGNSWPGMLAYTGSLATLINAIHAGGSKVIAVTVTPRSDYVLAGNIIGNTWETNRQTFNQALRTRQYGGVALNWDTIEDRDAFFNSTYKWESCTDTNLTVDGIHPNATANTLEALNMNNRFAGLPTFNVTGSNGLGSLAQQGTNSVTIVNISGSNARLGSNQFQALGDSWDFDSSLTADSTGTNNLTVSGPASFTTGIVGNAIQCSGSASAYTTYPLTQAGMSWSACGWFDSVSISTTQVIVGEFYNGSYGSWEIYLNGSKASLFIQNQSPTNNQNLTLNGTATLSSNTPIFVAATFSQVTGTSGILSLYVNNNTVVSGTITGAWYPLNHSGSGFMLSNAFSGGYFLNGWLDAWRFWPTYCLSGSEVAYWYNSGVGREAAVNDGAFSHVSNLSADSLSFHVDSPVIIGGTSYTWKISGTSAALTTP